MPLPCLCSATRRTALRTASGSTAADSDGSSSGIGNNGTSSGIGATQDSRIAELEAQVVVLQGQLGSTLAELEDAYSQLALADGELYAAAEQVGGRRMQKYRLPLSRWVGRNWESLMLR